MTPATLRALALHAKATSNELAQKADTLPRDNIAQANVAVSYYACASAFMTFARILGEAANDAPTT